MSTDKPESFEDFAKATGLSDLFDVDASSIVEDDDTMSAEDSDGDGILLAYRERTADDGEAVGTVALSTYGPSGTILMAESSMEALVEWLQARIIRARALAAEQGIEK